MKIGLFWGGAQNAARVKDPVFTPAAPKPAIARPTIRATEEGATPQIKLPTSRRKIASRNVIFRLKKRYALPPFGCC